MEKLIIALLYVSCLLLASGNKQVSFTKWGGIYLEGCASSVDIFPKSIDPALWKSCDDAYTYTWNLDEGNYLTQLTDIQRLKLIRSTGFCPHR